MYLYKLSKLSQKQWLSKVLVQRKEKFDVSNFSREGKVSVSTNPADNSLPLRPSNSLGFIFSGQNHCNTTISPQNLIVQVRPLQAQTD